jgi:serine/threonine protein kinase
MTLCVSLKGGFARCYELTDTSNKTVFAGKIVPKSLLVKPHQKEKMSMEIAVHRSLHHPHVVGFHGYFEDSENVYVLLEICRRRVMTIFNSCIINYGSPGTLPLCLYISLECLSTVVCNHFVCQIT